MSFKRIFVAIDNSESSSHVFNQALDLAQANQANLMLFHGFTHNSFDEPGLPLPIELGINAELVDQAYRTQYARLEQEIEAAQTLLSDYCVSALNQGVKAESDCKGVEDAGRSICQASQDWGADLIVLGRRGLKGLAEVLLGSVSNYVLHHAHCCVLVVQESKA